MTQSNQITPMFSNHNLLTFRFCFVLMASVLIAGCDSVRKLMPGTISTAETATNLAEVSNAEMLTADKCLLDGDRNRIKAIVCSGNAVIKANDGTAVRATQLLDKLYVFENESTRVLVGTDPRGTGEGFLLAQDAVITGQMQWLSFRSDNTAVRPLVDGYASLDDVRKRIAGQAVLPAFTEVQLAGSGNGMLRWMPVVASHEIATSGDTMQILELAAYTLQDEMKSSTAESANPGQEQVLRQCDLVTVLDCTGSMEPTWAMLLQHLDSILSGILKSDLDARIAFVAYRDSDDGNPAEWVTKASTFSKDTVVLKNWLSELVPQGGGDWDEAVFPSLSEAMELLKTGGRAGALQSIILIGDNAGHINGTDEVLGDNGKTVLSLATNRGISVNAIRMPYHKDFDGDKQLFPKQLQVLTTATHGLSLESTDSDGIVARLKKQILNTRAEAQLDISVAAGLDSGLSIAELSRRHNLPPAAMRWRADRVQKRLNADSRRVATPIGQLGIDRVFVVMNSQAMEFGVLMRRDELKTLMSVLDGLANQGIERPESLSHLWNNALTANVGDYDRPLHESLQLRGIPVRRGLLSMTLSELMAMPRAARLELSQQVETRFVRLAAAKIDADDHGNVIVPLSAMP